MDEFIDEIVGMASKLATKCAMDGYPSMIRWFPPRSCTESIYGGFVIIPYGKLRTTDSPPWVEVGR